MLWGDARLGEYRCELAQIGGSRQVSGVLRWKLDVEERYRGGSRFCLAEER